MLLRGLGGAYGYGYAILRYMNVYGPGQRAGVVPAVCGRLLCYFAVYRMGLPSLTRHGVAGSYHPTRHGVAGLPRGRAGASNCWIPAYL